SGCALGLQAGANEARGDRQLRWWPVAGRPVPGDRVALQHAGEVRRRRPPGVRLHRIDRARDRPSAGARRPGLRAGGRRRADPPALAQERGLTMDPFALPEQLNLAEVFLYRQARAKPDAPAIYFEDQVISYGA